jgi:hypothetical protein
MLRSHMKVNQLLEEHAASIFSAKEWAQHETTMKKAANKAS